MEIIPYKDDFVRTYSDGVEKEYKGTSIVYDDRFKVLLYHYFPTYKRLFVLSAARPDKYIINVAEKVRVVAFFENKAVSLFKNHLKSIIKNKQIFGMNEGFFVDLEILLNSKKPQQSESAVLFEKHLQIMEDRAFLAME